MHLPLPFLSQSSSTKRQTYPQYFHRKNVLTWTSLSFGLLILSLTVHNSQTLTVGDIPQTKEKETENRKKKKKKREQKNKQDCLDDRKGI